MTNCPNCGAPITGPRCEYCETVFDISKENELRIEIELGKAKTQYLHDMLTIREMYEDALRAMRRYTQV